MITSTQILQQLKLTFESFGTEFSCWDEVMNLDSIAKDLRTLPAEEAGLILREVVDRAPKKHLELHKIFIDELPVRFPDDTEEDSQWLDKLIEISGAQY